MLLGLRTFVVGVFMCSSVAVQAANNSEYSDAWIKKAVAESGFRLSMVTEDNFKDWMEFVEPTIEELDWNSIRWHHSLSAAAAEAKRLNRPILLWTMNGHPFSTT